MSLGILEQVCTSHTYLLAYTPAVAPSLVGSRPPLASLLAVADSMGEVIAAHRVLTADGQLFNGTITGLVASDEDGHVWACARRGDAATNLEAVDDE